MHINIDPKAIETAVTEAIIKSSIGAKLQEAIENTFRGGYNGPSEFQRAVNAVVAKAVSEILSSDEYKSKIEAAVRAKLDAAVIEKVCDSVVGRIANAAWRD